MGPTVIEKVQVVLEDIDYPAHKDEIVATAESRGADDEALRSLRGLPPVDYGSREEVIRSIDADPATLSDLSPGEQGRQHRENATPGLADHLKEVESSPIEDEIGWNKGS